MTGEDRYAVTSEEELRALIPPALERAWAKEVDHLDTHCRDFIARSPLVLLATADAGGACEVSPRGGDPGFVAVLDDRTLAIPDATGNRRIDSLRNLLQNPQAGLLFLLPGLGETLRVNGAARITRDPGLLRSATPEGAPPAVAVVVEVRVAYLHCAKALIRSKLWDPAAWPEEVPSPAQIFRDHRDEPGLTTDDVEATLMEGYRDRM